MNNIYESNCELPMKMNKDKQCKLYTNILIKRLIKRRNMSKISVINDIETKESTNKDNQHRIICEEIEIPSYI